MYKLYIKKNSSSKELLEDILFQYTGKKNLILKNEYGKPYLENNEYYFNVSNKKNISVCVIGDRPLGVDIEAIIYRKRISYKICNSKELEQLERSMNPAKEFTKMWVIKESYVKMIGIGLPYGLKNVDSLNLINKSKIIEYENYLISVIEG